jgi:hypothetical protein
MIKCRSVGIEVLFILLSIFVLGIGCAKESREQEMIRLGYNAIDSAQTKTLLHEPQKFDFLGNAFEVVPPVGFMMKETAFENVKLISFYHQDNSYHNSYNINITIYIPQEGSETTSSVIESIIAPYKKHYINYIQREIKPFANNNLVFAGASYSGQIDTFALCGMVFVASNKKVFYIIASTCSIEKREQFEMTCLDFVKSIKIIE